MAPLSTLPLVLSHAGFYTQKSQFTDVVETPFTCIPDIKKADLTGWRLGNWSGPFYNTEYASPHKALQLCRCTSNTCHYPEFLQSHNYQNGKAD